MKKIIISTLILIGLAQLFAATSNSGNTAEENSSGVDRYAIYIGSNKGGKGREKLLYAGSDAQNFQKAMSEIGGVSDSNSFILIDPTKEKIDDTLNQITNKIKGSETHAKRSEFIFYYSGHSDENSLLLGDVPYDYSSLKAAITEVPSDIHVVILDSCYSGNFIRTKGGQKRKPFLLDDSSVVTGHAYLSSSSDNEYSQESDEIESSYFTNAMITGLRGAADASGDNKVTLNELYSYAFNDTLSKTESSKAGPQHPNYNITLVGSGDLVLSDISTAESMLSLSKEAKGKFIIRNAEGKLISEINKVEGQPIFMALPAGQYSAVIIDEYSTKQGYFLLNRDQIYVLDQNTLSTIKRKENRLRGGEADSEAYEDEELLTLDGLEKPEEESTPSTGSRRRFVSLDGAEASASETEATDNSNALELPPLLDEEAEAFEDEDDISISDFNPEVMSYFHFSVFPGVNILGGGKDFSLTSLGIFGAYDKNVRIIQTSSLMNIVENSVTGLQASGLFNVAGGDVKGAQYSGLFNTAKDTSGAQVTGLFNITKELSGAQVSGLFNVAEDVKGAQITGLFNCARKVKGAQIGVVNIAEESDGIAIGVFNFIKNGMHHFCFSWNTDNMIDTYYQSGTRNFFVTLGMSYDASEMFKDDRKEMWVPYGGIGTEFRFGFIYLDFEWLYKFVLYKEDIENIAKNNEDFKVSKYGIPSFRTTVTLFPGRFFELNGGIAFDIQTHDENDRAFELTRHNLTIKGDEKSIHPSFFIGFKLK